MGDKRQNNQLRLAFGEEGRSEAPMAPGGGSETSTAKRMSKSPANSEQLMEQVCDRENCLQAYRRVKSNKGSAGIDGMTVEQLPEHLKEHWPATHMLKVHQTLGLITAIPMAAALITGPQAKVKGRNGQIIKEPSQTNLDIHAALGSLTTGLYITTAYYAELAPKIPGVKQRGAIRVHEALAFVHGPGMILTPILGIMAFRQENAGEKVHGIASYHGTVAAITAAAYGASIVAVSWPIHIKF